MFVELRGALGRVQFNHGGQIPTLGQVLVRRNRAASVQTANTWYKC